MEVFSDLRTYDLICRTPWLTIKTPTSPPSEHRDALALSNPLNRHTFHSLHIVNEPQLFCRSIAQIFVPRTRLDITFSSVTRLKPSFTTFVGIGVLEQWGSSEISINLGAMLASCNSVTRCCLSSPRIFGTSLRDTYIGPWSRPHFLAGGLDDSICIVDRLPRGVVLLCSIVSITLSQ